MSRLVIPFVALILSWWALIEYRCDSCGHRGRTQACLSGNVTDNEFDCADCDVHLTLTGRRVKDADALNGVFWWTEETPVR